MYDVDDMTALGRIAPKHGEPSGGGTAWTLVGMIITLVVLAIAFAQ